MAHKRERERERGRERERERERESERASGLASALTGWRRCTVVVVVPSLSKRQKADEGIVARHVARAIRLPTPDVRGRVDEPRHVVPQRHTRHAPHDPRQSAERIHEGQMQREVPCEVLVEVHVEWLGLQVGHVGAGAAACALRAAMVEGTYTCVRGKAVARVQINVRARSKEW